MIEQMGILVSIMGGITGCLWENHEIGVKSAVDCYFEIANNGGSSCRTCIKKLLSINYKKLAIYFFSKIH